MKKIDYYFVLPFIFLLVIGEYIFYKLLELILYIYFLFKKI